MQKILWKMITEELYLSNSDSCKIEVFDLNSAGYVAIINSPFKLNYYHKKNIIDEEIEAQDIYFHCHGLKNDKDLSIRLYIEHSYDMYITYDKNTIKLFFIKPEILDKDKNLSLGI